MIEIETSNFVISKQAKKLPEIIKIDEEFAYTLGLWKADKCSTAKGIVGLRSKDDILINKFKCFIQKLELEAKERTVKGYGITKEVYCCSMPLKRIFEFVSNNILDMLKLDKIKLAYLAGLVDGDGSTGGLAHLLIFYGLNKIKEAEKDSQLINSLNFKTTLKVKTNHLRLYILKPNQMLKHLSQFLILKRKLNVA